MNLLLKVCWSWSEFISQKLSDPKLQTQVGLLNSAMSTVSLILWVILALVGAAGGVYAIFLGVQLARAEEQGKRDDAKKHLITVFIAMGVTILLIITFNVFLPALLSAFIADPLTGNQPDEAQLQPLLSLVKARL